MLHAKHLIVIVALVAGSSAAQAASYYDTLKTRFNSLRSAPVEADFDRIGRPGAKICLEVRADAPNVDRLTQIARFTETREGRGPLLEQKRFVTVVMSEFGTPDISWASNNFTTTFGNREVITAQNPTPNYKLKLKIRKDSNRLVFERTEVTTQEEHQGEGKEPKKTVTTTVSYGYCYPPAAEDEAIETLPELDPAEAAALDAAAAEDMKALEETMISKGIKLY